MSNSWEAGLLNQVTFPGKRCKRTLEKEAPPASTSLHYAYVRCGIYHFFKDRGLGPNEQENAKKERKNVYIMLHIILDNAAIIV